MHEPYQLADPPKIVLECVQRPRKLLQTNMLDELNVWGSMARILRQLSHSQARASGPVSICDGYWRQGNQSNFKPGSNIDGVAAKSIIDRRVGY
jgi:hypothetical protein